MSSELLLIQLNQNMQKINSKSIEKPKSYEALKQYVMQNFKTNSISMYYFNQFNEKKEIADNEEFKKSSNLIFITEINTLKGSILDTLYDNLSESKIYEIDEKYLCNLCLEKLTENPYYCYQCSKRFCEKCLSKLDKQTKPLICPFCKYELPFEKWLTLKNFSDEKQKHLKLITENIKMNRQNSFHDIKETEFLKQNEILKDHLIAATQKLENQEILIKKKDEEIEKLKEKINKLGIPSYLNSVLQCLNSIQEFSNYNLKQKNIKFMEDNIKIMPLSFTISNLFKHFSHNPHEDIKYIYESSAIKFLLDNCNDIFYSDKNKNPVELFTYMLKKLHEEYLKSKPKNNNFKKNEAVKDKYNEMSVINHGVQNFQTNSTFICQIFAWFELENFKCTKCGKILFNFQFYFTLDLNILGGLEIANKNLNNENNNIISIYDCLKYLNKEKEQLIMCENCHLTTKMISTKKIYSPPNYFIFTCNWFLGDEDEKKKLNNVHLQLKSENIQLDTFIMNNTNDCKFYKIVGIVSYFEASKKFISYYLSSVNNKWYYCDDEIVGEITFDEILRRNDSTFENRPCILIYNAKK